jgi:hypothetical protein
MRSHMLDESCQTNCTHSATLDYTSAMGVIRMGFYVVHEVFNEGVFLYNWLELCAVKVDRIFNETVTSAIGQFSFFRFYNPKNHKKP